MKKMELTLIISSFLLGFIYYGCKTTKSDSETKDIELIGGDRWPKIYVWQKFDNPKLIVICGTTTNYYDKQKGIEYYQDDPDSRCYKKLEKYREDFTNSIRVQISKRKTTRELEDLGYEEFKKEVGEQLEKQLIRLEHLEQHLVNAGYNPNTTTIDDYQKTPLGRKYLNAKNMIEDLQKDIMVKPKDYIISKFRSLYYEIDSVDDILENLMADIIDTEKRSISWYHWGSRVAYLIIVSSFAKELGLDMKAGTRYSYPKYY